MLNVNLILLLNIKNHVWKTVNTEEIFCSLLCFSKECTSRVVILEVCWLFQMGDTESKGCFSNTSIQNSTGSNLNTHSYGKYQQSSTLPRNENTSAASRKVARKMDLSRCQEMCK